MARSQTRRKSRRRPGLLRRLLTRVWRRVLWGPRKTSPEYDRFMAGPVWRAQRLRVLRRDRFTCRDCGRRGNEGHHNWYAVPIEATPDHACVTLCGACHRRRHKQPQSPTSRRLWAV